MNWTEYKEACKKYAQFPEMDAHAYLYFGYWNEVGEVFGVLKKHLRGDFSKEEFREKLKAELGDVMWYIAMIDNYYGHDVSFALSVPQKHHKFSLLLKYTTIQNPRILANVVEGIAGDYDITLSEILQYNIDKLEDRLQRDVIKGSGDNR